MKEEKPKKKMGRPRKHPPKPHMKPGDVRRVRRPKIPMVTPDLETEGLAGKIKPRVIDFEQVLYWMDLGATEAEIAGAFRVGVNTLSRRLHEELGMGFAELKEKLCGAVKIKLRHNQINLSASNASMAIWLGKQWLDQREDRHKDGLDKEKLQILGSFFENVENYAVAVKMLKDARENQETEEE